MQIFTVCMHGVTKLTQKVVLVIFGTWEVWCMDQLELLNFERSDIAGWYSYYSPEMVLGPGVAVDHGFLVPRRSHWDTCSNESTGPCVMPDQTLHETILKLNTERIDWSQQHITPEETMERYRVELRLIATLACPRYYHRFILARKKTS